ncbi:MAG: hypothetical protein HZC38_16720, partial [Chloroflexi bacterium]|nr:hypothetical protein [Chloroflexota bacterium]
MIESGPRVSFRESAARAWQIVVPLTINGLIVAAATLVLVLPLGSSPDMLALRAGDVAPADITAPHSITYISKIQTDAARAVAIANTSEVFDPPDSRITRQQIARARQTLDYISSVRADEFAKPQQKINDLAALADAAVSPVIANALITLSDSEWTAVQNETASVIE